LDTKEREVEVAMLELQKQQLAFQHEKLVLKSSSSDTNRVYSDQIVANDKEIKNDADRALCAVVSIQPSGDSNSESYGNIIDEQKIRNEIEELRLQKKDMYQTLQLYEFKRNEYKNRRRNEEDGVHPSEQCSTEDENKAFLDKYKHQTQNSLV
jgi:hypothetical protein